MEKKIDGIFTRMLHAVWNNSLKPDPTNQQLYGYLPPISKTIQVRRTRPAGHNWRSKDELRIDVLLWTFKQGRASIGRQTRTYLHHHCADTGCSLEDLLEAVDNRDGWKENREICTVSAMMMDIVFLVKNEKKKQLQRKAYLQ